jgi:hypothetical protein
MFTGKLELDQPPGPEGAAARDPSKPEIRVKVESSWHHGPGSHGLTRSLSLASPAAGPAPRPGGARAPLAAAGRRLFRLACHGAASGPGSPGPPVGPVPGLDALPYCRATPRQSLDSDVPVTRTQPLAAVTSILSPGPGGARRIQA